ncbi:DNA primase small subunit PriS [uncultured archaeon]|nr:DNA primase small subunit PriS [uncultured archaeon]
METETRVFLKKKFKDYYFRHTVQEPPDIERREFGYGTLEDKIKVRHFCFAGAREFHQFLKRDAPFYLSYSTALYRYPANQPMAAKEWLGADVVFDLDVPMRTGYLNTQDLDKAKNEALSLSDFIFTDFGFEKNEVSVNFSGSKGYHFHIRGDRVQRMGQDERKELVDYVTGTGLKPIPDAQTRDPKGKKKLTFPFYWKQTNTGVEIVGGPKKGDSGWAGRYYVKTREILTQPDGELTNIPGIGEKTAKEIIEKREKFLTQLDEGNWSYLLALVGKRVFDEAKTMAVTAIADADKQVTGDLSRLIRVPDTLHAGSGLIAKVVKDLDSFDPLADAVAFSSEPTTAKTIKDVPQFDIGGIQHGPFKAGEKINLPECAAVYLMLKGAAEVVG